MAGSFHFIEAVPLYKTSVKEAQGHCKDARPVTFKTSLLKKKLLKEKWLLADNRIKRPKSCLAQFTHVHASSLKKQLAKIFFLR